MGYSPTLGRFINRDPIGYADGMNPYQAVRSSPTNFLDPDALRTIRQTKPATHPTYPPVPDDVDPTTYDCTGLAFRNFQNYKTLADVENALGKARKLKDCSEKCDPCEVKIWYWRWEYVITTQDGTAVPGKSGTDMHMVGGQSDCEGNDAATVVSKDGHRPIEGPKPPGDFKPLEQQPYRDPVDRNVYIYVRKNMQESCYCMKVADLPAAPTTRPTQPATRPTR